MSGDSYPQGHVPVLVSPRRRNERLPVAPPGSRRNHDARSRGGGNIAETVLQGRLEHLWTRARDNTRRFAEWAQNNSEAVSSSQDCLASGMVPAGRSLPPGYRLVSSRTWSSSSWAASRKTSSPGFATNATTVVTSAWHPGLVSPHLEPVYVDESHFRPDRIARPRPWRFAQEACRPGVARICLANGRYAPRSIAVEHVRPVLRFCDPRLQSQDCVVWVEFLCSGF